MKTFPQNVFLINTAGTLGSTQIADFRSYHAHHKTFDAHYLIRQCLANPIKPFLRGGRMKKLSSLLIVICLMMSTSGFAQTVPDMKKADQLAMKGRVMYSEGRYSAAIGVLKEAVEFNPTNGVAVYYLAMSHIRVGETGQAIALLEAYQNNATQKGVRLSKLDRQYVRRNRKLLTYAKTKIPRNTQKAKPVD